MYLFHGPDDYSARQRIKELAANHGGLTLVKDQESLASLDSLVGQNSLFGKNPLLVIRERLSDVTLTLLERWQDTGVVFWEGEKIDRRLKTTNWLLKNVHVEEFPAKNRQQVYAWVKQEGYDVDYHLLNLLWERHGNNLWAWKNELEKLQLSRKDSMTLTIALADTLSAGTMEENIFTFLDQIGERQMLPSIQLFDQLLAAGSDPFYLHTMIARQIRLLLLASEPNGLAGNPPFVVTKLKQQYREWSVAELLSAHTLLLTIDEQVKTGKLDMEEGIYYFLCSIRSTEFSK